jgi:hypothetical protein
MARSVISSGGGLKTATGSILIRMSGRNVDVTHIYLLASRTEQNMAVVSLMPIAKKLGEKSHVDGSGSNERETRADCPLRW